MLPIDAKVGKHEETPVRGDVLGPVQFVGGRARGVPLASRVLQAEDLGSPALSPDLPLREDDLGVVGGFVEKLPQNPMPDTRIRVFIEEPIPERARKRREIGEPETPI